MDRQQQSHHNKLHGNKTVLTPISKEDRQQIKPRESSASITTPGPTAMEPLPESVGQRQQHRSISGLTASTAQKHQWGDGNNNMEAISGVTATATPTPTPLREDQQQINPGGNPMAIS